MSLRSLEPFKHTSHGTTERPRGAFYGRDQHHDQQQLVEEKGFFHLRLPGNSPSDREAKAIYEADVRKEYYLLACSQWLA